MVSVMRDKANITTGRSPAQGGRVPTVTVLMPLYNAVPFLAQAIESILAQSYTDFELLIVDDGSTDDSAAIAAEYEQRDARVRLVRCPHQGVPTVNVGLGLVQSELLARMDADDVSQPLRLEKQHQYMTTHPECVAVGTWLIRTDPKLNPAGEQKPPLQHDEIDAALLRGDGSAIVQGTTMFRTSALKQIGGWRADFDWVEDLDLYLRLAEVGRLANLPVHLYQYRRHFQSVCARRYDVMCQNLARVLEEAWQRRGLPGQPDLSEVTARLGEGWSPAQYYRSWACHAMHQANGKLAREHAWQAVKREPMSLESWRVMYWSLAA